MKKILFIVIGLTVVFIVVGVWVYLMVFGAPKNTGEVFTNLGFSQNTTVEPAPVVPGGTDNPPAERDFSSALRQIVADRLVAGAVFMNGNVRFMERGTGHIYDKSLSSDGIQKVTGTTIPRVVDAVFSDDGVHVIITHDDGGTHSTSIGTVTTAGGEGVLTLTGLQPNVREVGFGSSTTVRYLEVLDDGVVGVELDLVGGKTKKLFASPLRQVSLVWGTSTLMYTTPSAKVFGYVYRLKKDFEYVSNGGFGLTAIPFTQGVVVSYLNDGVIVSGVAEESFVGLPISLLPEKCVVNPRMNGETLFCAAPNTKLSGEYPDVWYKGLVSLSDNVWEVDPIANTAVVLSDILIESGRSVDVAKIGTDRDGGFVYMINKNDGSLWILDLSKISR